MKRVLFGLFLALAVGSLVSVAQGALIPEYLRTESFLEPIGVDIAQPMFSWQLQADKGVTPTQQAAFRITVARSAQALIDGQYVWESGWVDSAESSAIYAGEKLLPDTDYYWTVQVKDQAGNYASAAKCAHWSTGLFQTSDWTASWIGDGAVYPQDNGDDFPFDPYFRKSIELTEVPQRAILYLASLGYHELYVNGQKVDDDVLAPNVSDLGKRALYLAYNIQPYLTQGKNTIAVWLGSGWSVFSDYDSPNKPKGPHFIAQGDLQMPDGSTVAIRTDESWKTAPSGNQLIGRWFFGNFGGECQEPAKMIPDWNLTSFDDSGWKNAQKVTPSIQISAQLAERNQLMTPIHPVAVDEVQPGVWRVDMGQNYAGWTEIPYKGTPGQEVVFLYSESTLHEMTFGNYNCVIPDESGEGVFKHHFNYSSGRWITVKGLTEKPDLSKITGWVIHTDYKDAASFECSDELMNWLYQIVLTTYESLSLGGYVVDCPQRERCGYGGDAHATSETGMYNYDLQNFYFRWMQAWRDVQGYHPDWFDSGPQPVEGQKETALAGLLPNTAPTYFGAGGPAWGGIVITLPWTHYIQYGDKRILEENFNLIEKWLGFLNAYVKDDLLYPYDSFSFIGDWLWPGAADWPDDGSPVVINNMYRIYNLDTAVKIARAIGRNDRAQEWEAMANASRKAVHAAYFHSEDNSYFDGRMAIQSAALLANVPPAELRDAVMKRLEKEVFEVNNGHIGVGITGGALMFKALRNEGRDDILYSVCSHEDYPSYGYMRANGATTLWECWEKDREGYSLLHSSYLYPGAWFIDSVLGIRPTEENPGFRTIKIRPPKYDATPLTWAKGHYDARTGRIAVDWKKENDAMILAIEIPANTDAEVFIPMPKETSVINAPKSASFQRKENGYAVYSVGSGSYTFTAK